MEGEEEQTNVVSVQLNPAILDNVRRRVYESLENVMVDSIYTFFSKMFLKAVEDSRMNPEELNPLNVFIDRLDNIPLWGETIVESTCEALREHAEKKLKFFDAKKYLKRILSTQLCQAAALENQACTSKIQLNDVHVHEFLYNLLKLSAPHVANAPQLFQPKRGQEYVQREQSLDMFLCRAVQRALSQFVELFLWRIEAGEIDSPFVAMPKAAIAGPAQESVGFKEIGDDTGRLSELGNGGDDLDLGAGLVGTGTGEGEEEENKEDKEEMAQMEFDDDPDKIANEDDENRPWKLDEGARGRYNEQDDLPDDERRNPRKLSFNEEVEVQEFKKEQPPSILSNRRATNRIYKTKFDPDA